MCSALCACFLLSFQKGSRSTEDRRPNCLAQEKRSSERTATGQLTLRQLPVAREGWQRRHWSIMQGETAGRDTRAPERHATAEDRSDGERQTGQQVRSRSLALLFPPTATYPACLRARVPPGFLLTQALPFVAWLSCRFAPPCLLPRPAQHQLAMMPHMADPTGAEDTTRLRGTQRTTANDEPLWHR